jgi:hypothetical protein
MPVVLPVWLAPEVELGCDCAFIMIVDMGNETKPISITKNKNITVLCFLIVCYVYSIKNKQSKHFIAKIRTILALLY